MVRGDRDYAIFEGVVGFEAEDAEGFYADVLVCRGVDHGRVGMIGGGAGEDVDYASVGVGDADQGEIDLLEGAVVVEG